MTTKVEPKEVKLSGGVISLEGNDGPLFKKARLCRTGRAMGVYGPIDVTREMLERVAERYNKDYAHPEDDSDLIPVLKNHNRDVDGILGRVPPRLAVEDWVDPATNVTEAALVGDLRIDDEIAQQKVKKRQYSQLSINFDEETYELFEVSFVAVEAARRSKALGKGENQMSVELQTKLDAAQKKATKLAAKRKALLSALENGRASRKEVCLALQTEIASGQHEIKTLTDTMAKVVSDIRTASLKAQFRGFLQEGKMTKAEFDGLKFQELSAQPASALGHIINSYKSRTPSSDVFQYGDASAKPAKLSKASPDAIRKAIKLQREGKGDATALAEGDAGASDKPDAADKGDKDDSSEFSLADMDDAMKAMEGMPAVVEKISSAMGKMHASLKKLMESDEKKDPAEQKDDDDAE